MSWHMERRLLQVSIALACLVPILGGLSGIVTGAGMFGEIGDVSLDSHVRYLSGLLLAIGIGFASTIHKIERHGATFQLLTALVLVGGVARAYALIVDGWPSGVMVFALVMELVVVPMLYVWQCRIGSRMSVR